LVAKSSWFVNSALTWITIWLIACFSRSLNVLKSLSTARCLEEVDLSNVARYNAIKSFVTNSIVNVVDKNEKAHDVKNQTNYIPPIELPI
jgi:hypothetical protein